MFVIIPISGSDTCAIFPGTREEVVASLERLYGKDAVVDSGGKTISIEGKVFWFRQGEYFYYTKELGPTRRVLHIPERVSVG